MNKSLIYKILPILFAVHILTACEEVLDVPITSELEATYFENENRVQRGIGGIYAVLQTLYGANLGGQTSSNGATLHPAWLLQGDDLRPSGTSNSSYEAFSGLSPADGRVSEIWEKLYFIVNRANFMLDKLDDPEIIKVYTTPNLHAYNTGEALFLRAWANYRLWDMFRKAPLQDKRINTVNGAMLPPTSGYQLLDAAISDLTEAAKLLPESWDSMNKGRVIKNSAYGLLVKSYVLRASYASKYNGNKNQDYQNAIEAFEKIDKGVSTIVGVHFGENFDYRTENNPESLFEYQASWAQKEDNAWLDNNFGGESGGMGVMYLYFTSHWGNYGSGGGVIGPTDKLMSMYHPEDPRIKETFLLAKDVDNVNGKLWWLGSAWNNFGGYQFVKYNNGRRGDIIDVKYQVQSGNNPRLLRLADVKLAVAEAYLQTGQPAKALEQVNDVRRRARLSTADGTESLQPADLSTISMQDIMDERLRELAGEEDFRWSDLKRWHAAGYINLADWTATDFGFAFDPNLFQLDVNKHLLFPIPNSEMNTNQLMNESGNNPGYN